MVACQIQTNLLAPSSASFVYTVPDANSQHGRLPLFTFLSKKTKVPPSLSIVHQADANV